MFLGVIYEQTKVCHIGTLERKIVSAVPLTESQRMVSVRRGKNSSCPARYDVAKLAPFRLPEHERGGQVPGMVIYERLKKSCLLVRCLTSSDLGVIRKRPEIFRQRFESSVIFAFGSAKKDADGDLSVPYIAQSRDAIEEGWIKLKGKLFGGIPIWHFQKR